MIFLISNNEGCRNIHINNLSFEQVRSPIRHAETAGGEV